MVPFTIINTQENVLHCMIVDLDNMCALIVALGLLALVMDYIEILGLILDNSCV